ncbi:hypothetical protein CEK00_14015 [Stenotrophomonas maltophilia]|uniref:DUF416 family protein n=1 Tax=Stenotrophomonas maltophilia TaxID=40324 RepID=A0A270NEK6_STEMA|nr:hypothetical protein [Stenotrophomonas maltophilia]PAM70513.1 hypothetical protein CEK00_14015 [Stenotrophomonas maltophilia]PZS97674.1 hypothetical protein A7X90_00805 [Stenotrophomonas maltophilia]PZT47083.1 hypothetical protein A7X99_00035 [Stenotrophomonas maltophilia]UXB15969.1 hypothetical protein K7565_19660 [Stenotrophomonas maltophilia]
MITTSQRRELLRALYSTERLYLGFSASSIFQEQPARNFLDSLWNLVATGDMPSQRLMSETHLYLENAVPLDQYGVSAADNKGEAFVLALDSLVLFLTDESSESLDFIPEEFERFVVEEVVTDEMIDQQGPTRQTLLVTTEVRAEIDNHPLIRAFLSQIQLDEWKSRSIDLNPEDIEKSKG